MTEPTIMTTELEVEGWHRSRTSFAAGEPPHVERGEIRARLSIVWADPDMTEAVAANDYDGCWAVIVRPPVGRTPVALRGAADKMGEALG